MGEGALRIAATEPAAHFVAQDEGPQHVPATKAPLLGDGQHRREDVRRWLEAAQAFAHFH